MLQVVEILNLVFFFLPIAILLFFKIYCQDVKSDIDLNKFGIKQAEISKSSNYISLEFVQHELDKTSNYLNHQTFSDNDFGYYFSEKIALFEIFSEVIL